MRASLAIAACWLACSLTAWAGEPDAVLPRPNILLIVADDLGYSDLSSWGGEIATPALDGLAAEGVRYTNFHVAATCSPTRAMLMTGEDHHRVGLGNMAVWMAPNQRGKPGYEGYLNDRVTTVPERLRALGYHTFMAGKWHLGAKPEQWPAARGFERDLSLIGGAGSHFSDMANLVPQRPRVTMTRDGKRIDSLPDDYFSTKNFTDFMIRAIHEAHGDGRPFFGYLALQVPHVPLQLPDDWIDRYAGRYAMGYDAVRQDRLKRQKELGLVPADTVLADRAPGVPAWDDLSGPQRRDSSRRMEIYAGIVANMDYHIGRLLRFLNAIGERRNTLVVFLSDNGPAAEDTAQFVGDVLGDDARKWFEQRFDNRYENFGRRSSWIGYGPGWAQVSATPLRLYKATLAEGGVRVPLIISAPGTDRAGEIQPALLGVTGLVQALLRLAKTGQWSAASPSAVSSIGMELFGQRALIDGGWKLLDLGDGMELRQWRLFDLKHDPAERHNLSARFPQRVSRMSDFWKDYARANGVILPEGRKQPRPSSPVP